MLELYKRFTTKVLCSRKRAPEKWGRSDIRCAQLPMTLRVVLRFWLEFWVCEDLVAGLFPLFLHAQGELPPNKFGWWTNFESNNCNYRWFLASQNGYQFSGINKCLDICDRIPTYFPYMYHPISFPQLKNTTTYNKIQNRCLRSKIHKIGQQPELCGAVPHPSTELHRSKLFPGS